MRTRQRKSYAVLFSFFLLFLVTFFISCYFNNIFSTNSFSVKSYTQLLFLITSMFNMMVFFYWFCDKVPMFPFYIDCQKLMLKHRQLVCFLSWSFIKTRVFGLLKFAMPICPYACNIMYLLFPLSTN